MIVPRHWAEATKEVGGRKRRVLRRFGWSDASEADARAMAEQRVAEAAAAYGRAPSEAPTWVLREPRVPYNGAVGVPIREAIVETHGEVVVTRNSYGARCLNVADVVFADVDFDGVMPAPLVLGLVIVTAVVVTGACSLAGLPKIAATGIAFGVCLLVFALLGLLDGALDRAFDLSMRLARHRAARFLAARGGGRIAVYRTPAGARLLWLHRRATPDDPEVARFFDALSVDPTYVRMCTRQRCFRARVTAKPWRAGFHERITPRPGTHPIAESRRPMRDAWVARYEAHVQAYAACERLADVGDGLVDRHVAPVEALHDRLCRVGRGLPIA